MNIMDDDRADAPEADDERRAESPLASLSLTLGRGLDELARRIGYQVESRPNAARFLIASFLVLSFIVLFKHSARAGMLQVPIDISSALSAGLYEHSFALAQAIFGALAFLTVVVAIVASYIRNQSVRGLGQVLLTSVLRLGIPFVIITSASTFVPSIANVGLQVAAIISGAGGAGYGDLDVAPAPNDTTRGQISNLYGREFPAAAASVGNLDPGNIVNVGTAMSWDILKAVYAKLEKSHSPIQGANPQLNQGFGPQTQAIEFVFTMFLITLCTSIVGAFTFIAVELILAYVQVYLALPLGAWALGFLGSPATRGYANGYWQVVVQALLRFVVVVFVIGFAVAIAVQWKAAVEQAIAAIPVITPANPGANPFTDGNNFEAFKIVISTAFMAFSLLYIIRVLPSMIMGVVTGYAFNGEGNQAEGQVGQAIGGGMQRSPGFRSAAYRGQTSGRAIPNAGGTPSRPTGTSN